jgi:hypothetical protein
VSLILDALKKLEREKQSGEPGVVVVGHVPWGGGRGRPVALVGAGVLAVALVGLGAWWWLRSSAPASRPAASRSGREGDATTPTRSSPSSSAPSPLASPPVLAPAAPTTAPVAPPARPRPDTPAARPAAPPGAAPAAFPPTELRLNAISVRDGRPIALLNDRLVHEGESFDGIRVLRIGEAEVEVEVRGQRRVIRF